MHSENLMRRGSPVSCSGWWGPGQAAALARGPKGASACLPATHARTDHRHPPHRSCTAATSSLNELIQANCSWAALNLCRHPTSHRSSSAPTL